MSDLSKINILVVGSGGREHALVQKCRQSPLAARIIAAAAAPAAKAKA
jgi:phosphoribosylamine--glycine ligase